MPITAIYAVSLSEHAWVVDPSSNLTKRVTVPCVCCKRGLVHISGSQVEGSSVPFPLQFRVLPRQDLTSGWVMPLNETPRQDQDDTPRGESHISASLRFDSVRMSVQDAMFSTSTKLRKRTLRHVSVSYVLTTVTGEFHQIPLNSGALLSK